MLRIGKIDLCIWFAVNKLTMNITKISYMLFGSRMLNKEVNIEMQNVNIERVRVTKFLGVFIDELVNGKAHKICTIKAFKKYRCNV